MTLPASRRRQAETLQQRGLLLREIAARLDCGYWDVVESLYGDAGPWRAHDARREARRRSVEPLPAFLPVREPEPHAGGGSGAAHSSSPSVGGAVVTSAADPEGDADRQSHPADEASEAARNRPDLSVRAEAPPAPVQGPPEQQRDTPGVTGGESAATSPASAPRQLYRLVNEIGEWLHKSGTGMTRNRAQAWMGTAPQMEEAFRRKPHLKELDAEEVR